MQKTEYLTPGKTYKIVQQGNGAEPLFFEPNNKVYFKTLVARHLTTVCDVLHMECEKYRITLYVHFRDEAEIPEKFRQKLHLPLSNLFNSYAKSVNKYYGRSGSLFRTRFERSEIPGGFQI